MQIYSQKSEYTLLQGNMLDMWDFVGGGTIDSIVTDPPYELNFMWKGWDNSWIAFQPDTWKRCLEALKPWWYLLAFWGSRTYHRIACAIEDAGFEIRDCIMWLYGSWFPKSLNIWLAIDKKNWVESEVVGTRTEHDIRNNNYANNDVSNKTFERDIKKATNERAWWWTALKPSYEPIIVARKPLEWSCTDNVIKYWVGGINIDECRVETQDDLYRKPCENGSIYSQQETKYTTGTMNDSYKLGRFPANTILTYWDDDKEEVCGGFPNSWKWNNKWTYNYAGKEYNNSETSMFNWDKPQAPSNYNDNGSASRYFYCAKASRRDRDEGLGTETTIDIILSDKNWKIWKGENIIRDEKLVNADIEAYLKSDTGEYGTLSKEDLDLSIISYMKNIIEKYLNECKSTTKMGINSTTIYQILNWLIHLNTKENTLDVKKYDELYTSLVESAENWSLLTLTIKERTELAHDAENAVLKVQLRIREKEKHSTHPTVKPTELMQYLVRLVTPNGWTVLDPFNWSGSTWKAVMYENKDRNKNYKYIWIELTEEYLPIAKARIEYVINKGIEKEKSEPKQEEQTKQRKESALF